MPGFLTIETQPGRSVIHRGWRLTPFALTWRLRLPSPGPNLVTGLVWGRPISVLVADPDDRETVLPVPDPTRQIMWSLAGICLLTVLTAGWMNWRYWRKIHNGRRSG